LAGGVRRPLSREVPRRARGPARLPLHGGSGAPGSHQPVLGADSVEEAQRSVLDRHPGLWRGGPGAGRPADLARRGAAANEDGPDGCRVLRPLLAEDGALARASPADQGLGAARAGRSGAEDRVTTEGGTEEDAGEVAEAPRPFALLSVVLRVLGIAGLLWSGIQEARTSRPAAKGPGVAPAFQ